MRRIAALAQGPPLPLQFPLAESRQPDRFNTAVRAFLQPVFAVSAGVASEPPR
jgi:hypothetical protein